MKTVGYDAQAFLSPSGGTGKGRQLRTLLGIFSEEFIGFASTDPNPHGLPLIQEGLAGYNAWQQFSLPQSLKRHGIEVFLAPYNTAPFFLPSNIQLILVLHDTTLMKNFRAVKLKERLLNAYRRWQIGPSVRRASVVLTVSNHARSEILAAFPGARVEVIPCTVDRQWFAPRPLEERAGYILLNSSVAPHKNARGALQAYALYVKRVGGQSRALHVVGIGKHGDRYRNLLAREGITEKVTFLPFLAERELIQQYQDAAALLFPSFAEGFGIPVLEAMATGTPVIASHTTSIPEVGDNAAHYFNPYDVNEMASVMTEVLENPGMQREMSEKGLVQAESFAPERIGERVVEFWHRVARVKAGDHALADATRESDPAPYENRTSELV